MLSVCAYSFDLSNLQIQKRRNHGIIPQHCNQSTVKHITNPLNLAKPLLTYGLSFSFILLALYNGQDFLRYERSLILEGEYWRLLGAHFAHLNLTHLALNLAGWWLFLLLCGHLFSSKQLTINILILALGISFGLLILRTDFQWYLGFSGVLYGLLLIGSLRFALQEQRLIGALIFGTLTVKMALDIYSGQTNTSALLIGAPVATVAHVYGLIIGLLLSLPALAKASSIKQTPATQINKTHKNKK